MKQLFISALLLVQFFSSSAQTDEIIHEGTFPKNKLAMSSNPYKPDNWEQPYYDSSIKTAFPSDLINHPDKYDGKLIHLIGIVDSAYLDSNATATFILENKFWDYIEDYSIQDEKMFISEKGDGKFIVRLNNINAEKFEAFKKFPEEKKLFLVYGKLNGTINRLPVLTAKQIKYINYELYTTTVFSYEILRDKKGNIVTNKEGRAQTTNFKFLKVAKRGQNK